MAVGPSVKCLLVLIFFGYFVGEREETDVFSPEQRRGNCCVKAVNGGIFPECRPELIVERLMCECRLAAWVWGWWPVDTTQLFSVVCTGARLSLLEIFNFNNFSNSINNTNVTIINLQISSIFDETLISKGLR